MENPRDGISFPSHGDPPNPPLESSAPGGTKVINTIGGVPTIPEGNSADDSGAAGKVPPRQLEFWLDGGILACVCPGCGGPMSIRLWLRLADCFHCQTSVELTEEELWEAQRLLQTRRGAGSSAPGMTPPGRPIPLTPPPAAGGDRGSLRQKPVPAGSVPPTQARPPFRYKARPWHLFLHLPSWLISAIFHAILLLIFGLLAVPGSGQPTITITTTLSPEDREGEELIWEADPLVAWEMPDPVPPTALEVAAVEELMGNVDLPLPPADPPAPNAPLGAETSSNQPQVLPPAMQPGGLLSGRNPNFRRTLALERGGSEETEAAVALGLAWLARHQNANGSWSLDKFHMAPKATSGAVDGLGSVYSDTAATAMALMAFLGAGQTHKQGQYQDVVRAGLRWLVYNQGPDGDLRGPGSGRMYAHGMASIVLCEAFAMTGDDNLRVPAQRAIDFIVRAQHPAGGWRYEPGQAGDTSIVGWQLMALQSGRLHYHLHVPDNTLRLAENFLDSVKCDYSGATYGYMPGHSASPAMTAEALLCRLYLGWPPNHRAIRAGVQWLLSEHLPSLRHPDIYYWYYGTQVMHHVGGQAFRKWNYAMRPILLELQEKSGRNAGSWPPLGAWSSQGGRIFMTSLAICILEVYYRHMPLNRAEAIEIDRKLQKVQSDVRDVSKEETGF